MMAKPYSKLLNARAAIHVQASAKGPSQHLLHLTLTLQAPLDLLDHVAQVAGRFTQQPVPVTESSLTWVPRKTSSFLGPSINIPA